MSDFSTIITIGRQFGSGGKVIGEKLAERLGVKFYDKELLQIAAKESGICKDLFETNDEKATNSFLYSLVMDTYSMNYSPTSFGEMSLNQKIFLAQFDAIKRIADEGPCVIVGRCADYALEGRKELMSVFISADEDDRIGRTSSLYDIGAAKAKDMNNKTDKSRSSYYNYYSNKKWGVSTTYDVCLNSSRFGIDGTVDALYELVMLKEKLGK